MSAALAVSSTTPIDRLQTGFLRIKPRLELHARICSRNMRCPGKRADFVSEVIALCWKWWVRLFQRGKNPSKFVSVLATFAARQVLGGRRLTGQERARDVLSPRAQLRHGFTVSRLPQISTLEATPYSEALRDNRKTPVDEQVQFRLDWPYWLDTRTERDRQVICDMAIGHRTQALARLHGMSPSRVSQLRREYKEPARSLAAASSRKMYRSGLVGPQTTSSCERAPGLCGCLLPSKLGTRASKK
jgi:hypothetical protein